MQRLISILVYLSILISAGLRSPTGSIAEEAHDVWVKLCMKNEQTGGKQICLVSHEGLDAKTGGVLVAAAVRKVEGEDEQKLLVRVPTAYSLVIPAGAEIRIDNEKPIRLKYSICFPTSCQVETVLTDDLYRKMRAGKQMVVAATNIQRQTISLPVPLTGFVKAYDGKPVDREKYEEQRRQLMAWFSKHKGEPTFGGFHQEPSVLAVEPASPVLDDLGDLPELEKLE